MIARSTVITQLNYPITQITRLPDSRNPPMDNITSLQITDGAVGGGAVATPEKSDRALHRLAVRPKAADKHGNKFDSSRDRGEPFRSRLAPAASSWAGIRASPG